jgi:tetratricopeptide (TPR) repeat protein
MYNNMGKYEQALENYQKSLKIKLCSLGENHPNKASSYNKIGDTYDFMGKYENALENYEKSL